MSPHPTVQDVVIIQSISEEVTPDDAVTSKLVVVGALCAAAVLRGADVYAPGVQAAPSNLQVLKSYNTGQTFKSSSLLIFDPR